MHYFDEIVRTLIVYFEDYMVSLKNQASPTFSRLIIVNYSQEKYSNYYTKHKILST